MPWSLTSRQAVVIDNDWAGDPDGLAALAHHVLSPADDVVAVTASFTSPVFGDPAGSAAHGAELAAELLRMLGASDVSSVGGVDAAFAGEARRSAAARAIVDAASGQEIVVVCGGPLTNIADALRLDPGVAARIRLVWVGGTMCRDRDEYNHDTDPAAADFVFGHADLRIDRFPAETYRLLAVSVAELEERLTSSGETGTWLWQRYRDLPIPPGIDVDPVWPLGDNAPLVATALPHAAVTFAEETAYRRVCTSLDARLVVEDFFARLRLHARS